MYDRLYEKNIHSTQTEIIRQKYAVMLPHLNERSLRAWAASEALALGHDGKKILHIITGLSYTIINVGVQEIKQLQVNQDSTNTNVKADKSHIRKIGGGRIAKVLKDPSLESDLLGIMESNTRGDPATPLLWSSKSTRHIASVLNQTSKRASHQLLSKMLSKLGYSLQSNRKMKKGTDHPDRDAQFKFINNKTKEFQEKNQPVIFVDTKKKELIGECKNGGVEYTKKGDPTIVNIYDFINESKGKTAPYGIDDISKNNGWVSVGVSSDTAEFAVNSIRSW